AAAQRLFLSVAGERYAADPELGPLLSDVDFVPLAVELLARLVDDEPELAALRRRRREQRAALLARGPRVGLAASVDLALGAVEDPYALALLSWLPDGIARRDLAELLPDADPEALCERGLAFEEADRLRLPAAVRDHARL